MYTQTEGLISTGHLAELSDQRLATGETSVFNLATFIHVEAGRRRPALFTFSYLRSIQLPFFVCSQLFKIPSQYFPGRGSLPLSYTQSLAGAYDAGGTARLTTSAAINELVSTGPLPNFVRKGKSLMGSGDRRGMEIARGGVVAPGSK